MQGLLLAGRYRLGETIGRGGMGRVWRAHDELLNRTVAVKELTAAQYVSDSDRVVMLARTQTEARAAARVNHPAVVTIHDVLEHDDRPWIVMELVEGRSLADAVKESGRLEVELAARAGLWVLRALRAAHAAGVLHRDVKPGNVLLADDGRVLLTDFGIAQVEGDTTLTKTGEVVGSVDYLAPERVRGADPGPASDLWALGATLYTAVEGRSPFRRTTPLSTMQAVVDDEPTPPGGGGRLAPVIMALLRKDPAARPGADDAERMLTEVAEGREPTVPQARPRAGRSYGRGGGMPAYDRSGRYAYDAPARGYEPRTHQRQSFEPHTPQTPYPLHGPGRAGVYGPPRADVPPGGRGGGRQQGRRRSWGIAGVVLAAALVGGATAAGLLYYTGDDNAAGRHEAAGAPSRGTKPSEAGSGTSASAEVPDGWKRVADPKGFSVMVPEDWQREAGDGQIDYTPDHGNHFLRIGVDDSPDWDSPYLHQQDLEKQLDGLPDYNRLRLGGNTFRDQPGSLWEFTWTAAPSDPVHGPRHAKEETYIDRDGVEYALYISAPAADWDTTRQQFDQILRGWRP